MAAISVPVLWGGELSETLDFYRTLGYRVTYEMTRPYTYGMVERDGYQLHFGPTPKGMNGKGEEAHIGCLVAVDDVEPWHAEFKAALRARYGKIPSKGVPRITRFRPGQTRFSVVDPVGNTIIYVQRDEPDPEYGGSKRLEGLARVLDNARIFRDSKTDDATAARAIETGLRRHGATATPVERARALAMLAEIAAAAGDSERVTDLLAQIEELGLGDRDRAAIADDLAAIADAQE
ncbi:glyoxalase [Nocardia sp. CDC153]|uniref:glyoxalase n=1 Tax=Nocardia sp. CDC153 TaxID=3112167 RepID=UPI002DB8927D|nr:glyoxalase [Nocardia sp. CDC153]MEC3956213.1 glyoxalase [Nocardia sp. CDC153]